MEAPHAEARRGVQVLTVQRTLEVSHSAKVALAKGVPSCPAIGAALDGAVGQACIHDVRCTWVVGKTTNRRARRESQHRAPARSIVVAPVEHTATWRSAEMSTQIITTGRDPLTAK